ncbi:YdeI/OmpD-associated family protein [Fulvivirga sp.]|uniref:YdeI/OmpD-associated family protein n=1 Tax=Fulvivirga sp. TaxID=1931237 RepID=UPI0032EF2F3F
MFKFTSVKQIEEIEDLIKAYIYEAIEVEKAGLKVDFRQKDELDYPEELKQMFSSFPALSEAFEALTPGRKRGYIIHFSQPKQSATRTSRIEKCIAKIMEGKGFFDN